MLLSKETYGIIIIAMEGVCAKGINMTGVKASCQRGESSRIGSNLITQVKSLKFEDVKENENNRTNSREKNDMVATCHSREKNDMDIACHSREKNSREKNDINIMHL